ncbi:MAG: hypothetical protein LBM73_03835 [Candidatus Nomurabacteria bacterium]|jgi:hypothetical protein|nr:hypothetical protein [Candidatus Nomurabacteria bacterium]
MHYEFQTGVKSTRLFGLRGLLILGGLLLAILLYAGLDYGAPHLFALSAGRSQAALDQLVKTRQPDGTDQLIIPTAGVNVEVSQNFMSGSAQLKPGADGGLVVSAPRFNVGLTPGETVAGSPLYNLTKAKTGDYVYLDDDGERLVYQVRQIQNDVAASGLGGDLLVYSYNDDGDAAASALICQKVGQMVWSGGSATIVAD